MRWLAGYGTTHRLTICRMSYATSQAASRRAEAPAEELYQSGGDKRE
jgi:hypothetical protein